MVVVDTGINRRATRQGESMYHTGTPTKAMRRIATATFFTVIAAVAALALPASAQAAPARTSAPVAPAAVAAANPRVGCGGANTTVSWGARNIDIIGNAWDNCGAGSYVQIFLSWYSPTYHNQRVATAGPHSHINFSWGSSTTLSPGRIVVTACEHFNGWHCGAGVHV
jgi:hypothetical protein